MSGPRIAYILPSYGQWEYVEITARSFFKHTPDGTLILIDDCSPDANEFDFEAFERDCPKGQTIVHRFPENGGLTRSWNEGLCYARKIEAEYAICGNSDVKFTSGWAEPLIAGITSGYQLAGPVTNAPGVTARGLQDVGRYVPSYQLNDDDKNLESIARQLRASANRLVVSPTGINGFFMFSSTAKWWELPFDNSHVFNPSKAFRMQRQEDELEGRMRRAGKQFVVCPASFIFHYRTVSRHQKFRKRGWYRRPKA